MAPTERGRVCQRETQATFKQGAAVSAVRVRPATETRPRHPGCATLEVANVASRGKSRRVSARVSRQRNLRRQRVGDSGGRTVGDA